MLSAGHLIFVDSHNKINGTDENFSYLCGFPTDQKKFSHIVVLNANIPKSYYLVQAGLNTFQIIEPGFTTRTISVTPGDYVLTTFQSVIQTLLNTGAPAGWVYAVSYPNVSTQANTGKFTFSVTGNAGAQPSIVVTDSFYKPFGFSKSTTNAFVSSTLTSTNVVKLQVEDRLFINSNIVQGTSLNNNNVLQDFNATATPDYSTLIYQCTTPEYSARRMNSQLNNIYTFTLTNEDDVIMNLNGLNLTFTLFCFSYTDIFEKLDAYFKYIALKEQPHDGNVIPYDSAENEL